MYAYDVFNQLNKAVYGSFKPKPIGSVGTNTLSLSENFKVDNITYDKNGNLETLERKNDIGVVEDNLDYDYKYDDDGDRLNQLDHVAGVYQSTQSDGNYHYDDSGRLIRDNVQGIKYLYNVQGLVTKITDLSDVAIVEYVYDDGGFRSKKKNYTAGVLTKTTLYVRDLSGQITGIYEKSSSVYNLVETPFYGSSRLGTKHGLNTYVYELKDHLGNIRQTIKTIGGDIPVETSADWAYSKAEYYPFGMKFMNSFSGANPYRYGYQGEYAEDETDQDGIKANSFQLRLYNPRLGRWMSPDPKSQYVSPYLAMGNNPISMIDRDGGYAKWVAFILNGFSSEGLHNPTSGTDDYNSNGWGYNTGNFDGESYNVTFNDGDGLYFGPTGQSVLDFGDGAVNAWSTNQIGGLLRRKPTSQAMANGQLVGDVVSVVQGAVEVVGGATGFAAGGVMDATGVLIVPGLAVGVASTATMVHGGTVTASATKGIGLFFSREKSSSGVAQYKKPISNQSGKSGAKDTPHWTKGEKPYVGESGAQFAKRLCDAKYGAGNYSTKSQTEYAKIKKWGERAFE